tara:strand:+ start:838 stop:1158 length:321 start_codon:yes stop_codon:yes gene_type:complete
LQPLTKIRETLEQQLEKNYERIDDLKRNEWIDNPCSKLLMIQLQLDTLEIMEIWGNSGYTSEQLEASMQLNSAALGQLEAIRGISDWIEDNLKERVENNDTESSRA